MRVVLSACFLAILGGCSGRSGDSNDEQTEDAGAHTHDAGNVELDAASETDGSADPVLDASPSVACEEHEVTCIDESIATLDLFDTVSPDGIVDESGDDAAYFDSLVDSTGGGLTPTQSFVYAKFTPDGLEKVDIDDIGAFESDEWDIAFRRFVIRLNSGVGGPSCVHVGRTAPSTDFLTLDEVPSGLQFREEEYFTDSCEYVPDGSGIGSPATALSSFWTYPGCVAMTGNVYVVQLASGEHVKLQVRSYYSPENQAECDESGTVPMPSGAGALRIRWAFID